MTKYVISSQNFLEVDLHSNQEYDTHSIRKRISALIVAVSFIFFALVIRLFYIEVISSARLQNLAYSQWTRDLPITAERGKIYDRGGATLAVSLSSYNLYSRGREIKDINKVASYLAKKLDMSYDVLYNKLSLKNVSEVLIKLQIDSDTAKQILMQDFPGIFLSQSIQRYYPYGNLLTQVLGFCTIDNIGQAGIEAYFNEILTGENGKYVVQSDLTGKEIENSLQTFIEGKAGDNIYLTIDVGIQLILENVLEQIYTEQKAKSVSALIMRAETGEIVASSTKPSFDLNNLPRDNVSEMMEQVKNKLVVDVYEPGSTFKILTMCSALEKGVTNLNDRFYCPGYRVVDGQKIKCWKTTGHGSQTLTEGIVNSCNCVFMDLASRLGTQSFYEYLKNFGIGQKTGVQIAGESNGIMMNSSYVKNVDLARIGFGQAIAVTPLQLLSAVCSAVNGGYKVSPSIISKTTSANGTTKSFNDSSKNNRIISSKTSEIINQMLYAVVNKTTDYSFVEGYDVGGKTGTAQKYENGAIARGKYISSFVGTYPTSNPEYVMLLLVDEPGAGAYYGSVVASPYAKMIFSKMFEYLGEKPQNENVKNEYATMPYIEGLSLSKAISELTKLKINYEIDGEGGFVQKQLPPAGTKINLNDYVLIVTN
ncbi:MAG: PASTA domain-containing protein [Clostridia bacterium]|nr:PASTA domain-containing protein [Clostridia bacterium]